jgi:hypothetical protein
MHGGNVHPSVKRVTSPCWSAQSPVSGTRWPVFQVPSGPLGVWCRVFMTHLLANIGSNDGCNRVPRTAGCTTRRAHMCLWLDVVPAREKSTRWAISAGSCSDRSRRRRGLVLRFSDLLRLRRHSVAPNDSLDVVRERPPRDRRGLVTGRRIPSSRISVLSAAGYARRKSVGKMCAAPTSPASADH